ncbi:M61 family metallopeptidase [Neiella sp. HB171785]|uniref:M61 family metallopeptidase n=1 Tax=Neiella litorisoli TaxID=2771431 RepID=A0A8J6QUE5_9GAMM|nr:M61 family metallopeptidase [Neiella litorisoli]
MQVEIEMDQLDGQTLQFAMPIWRTGRYEQLDFASAMTNLEVVDSKGNPLPVTAISDHQWQAPLAGSDSAVIRYLLTADDLAMRTRHLDESHLFVDFAAAVVAVEGVQEQSYQVELSVPRHWQVRSGLAQGATANVLIADNYQQLVDSPVEAGEHEYRSFNYQGAKFELVVWGHTPADLDKLNADIKKLVVASYQLWGHFPFSKYVFMVHATDNIRGGTEHLNSTIMQWDRFKFNDDENYLDFMGLVAHEFVHTWNVKAYRPAAFVPYDLNHRHHSTLLWLAEGSTSYLQEKLLLKSGLMDEAKFYQRLAKRLSRHQATPGGSHQAVADASWYKWNQHGGQHGHNFDANIYQEGFAATLALDIWLLQHSDNQAGVAALHRLLYQRFSLPNGLTEAQVQQAMAELVTTPADVGQWWQQHIDSPLAVDWSELLAEAGLQNKANDKAKFWFGASLKAAAEALKVGAVATDSPAWTAGLTQGDRIVAVDGFAVHSGNFDRVQHSWAAGQTLHLHLFRQGILTKREVTLAPPQQLINKLQVAPKTSSEADALRKAWLANR